MKIRTGGSEDNQRSYADDAVVSQYVEARDLMPPEQFLFDKYIQSGMDILDVGVGGGRTTAYLAPQARSYLGLDYVPEMVVACRRKFPSYVFEVGDATNLLQIADASFDLTIFSFNGIDSIASDEGRLLALKELRRVTRDNGFVIISSHNAKQLMLLPQMRDAGLPRAVWRVLRASMKSILVASRNLGSGAFLRGSGYIRDPVHGGLTLHVSSPASIAAEAAQAKLRIVETVASDGKASTPLFASSWTTFVLSPLPA